MTFGRRDGQKFPDRWSNERYPRRVLDAIWAACFDGFLSLHRKNRMDSVFNFLTVLDVRTDRYATDVMDPLDARNIVPPPDQRASLGWMRERVVQVSGWRYERKPNWLALFDGIDTLPVLRVNRGGYICLRSVLALPRIPVSEWCFACGTLRGQCSRVRTEKVYIPNPCRECQEFQFFVSQSFHKEINQWIRTRRKIRASQEKLKAFRAYLKNQQAGRSRLPA